VKALPHDLGCQKYGRAHHTEYALARLFSLCLANPVAQFHRVGECVSDDVGGFEVTMNNAILVKIQQTHQHMFRDMHNTRLHQRPAARDDVGQGSASDPLHEHTAIPSERKADHNILVAQALVLLKLVVRVGTHGRLAGCWSTRAFLCPELPVAPTAALIHD